MDSKLKSWIGWVVIIILIINGIVFYQSDQLTMLFINMLAVVGIISQSLADWWKGRRPPFGSY